MFISPIGKQIYICNIWSYGLWLSLAWPSHWEQSGLFKQGVIHQIAMFHLAGTSK